jgi:hypothetical protein
VSTVSLGASRIVSARLAWVRDTPPAATRWSDTKLVQ